MATATKNRSKKATTGRKAGASQVGPFPKTIADSNQEHAINALRKKAMELLKSDDIFLRQVARKAGIKFTWEDYSREMLTAWPKQRLVQLGEASGIELPAKRDRTVDRIVDALIKNRERLIVPQQLQPV